MNALLAQPELALWLCLFARIAPSAVLLSSLARGALPIWLALGFALALALGMAVGLPPLSIPSAPAWWLGAFARELCVGLCFAGAALVPFLALRVGLDYVLREPLSERASFAHLYLLAAAALTLSLGGLRAYVKALSGSLTILPLLGVGVRRASVLAETQAIVGQAIEVALALGLPLLLALWLIDLCLALAARVAHTRDKVETLPARRALALGLLVLLCAPLASRLPELTRAALSAAEDALRRLAA